MPWKSVSIANLISPRGDASSVGSCRAPCRGFQQLSSALNASACRGTEIAFVAVLGASRHGPLGSGFKPVDEHVILDPSRVAAQVVSGSAPGAGSILLCSSVVRGLTTVSIWTVAAIGLAIGGGLYSAGIPHHR